MSYNILYYYNLYGKNMSKTREIIATWKNYGAFVPLLFALGGAFFVGISPILVRVTHTGPIVTAFYRLLFALPFLWVWMRIHQKKGSENIATPKKYDYLLLILSGIFLGLELSLWYSSLNLTSVVNSTLLNNFSAFIVPILAWALFSKRPSMMFLLSVLVALFGIILLVGDKLTISAETLHGDLLAACSALFLSGYYLVMEHLRKRFTTPIILWWSGLATCTILCLMAICFEDQLLPCTLYDCLGFLVLAIFIHIGGQGFIAQAVGLISASSLAMALLISPVISAILAWAIFSESLSLTAILGCALVLCSLFFAQQQKSPA